MSATEIEGKRWFVLNYLNNINKRTSPQRIIDSFNSEGHDLELFAPMIRPARVVNGKVRAFEKLLTFYYVFVRGEFHDIKQLCIRPDNSFSLMLDRSSDGRYAIISDAAMENFKIIARARTNSIPFYNIDDIELQEGDLVEVVGGDYDGLRGTFMPRSRTTKGNLVIAATAAMGAILWDIDAKNVRILRFAPRTRRQYDLIDSFIPRLFPILRKFRADEPLTEKEKSQLHIFSQRMGEAVPANHKAEAKLLAVLMSVRRILGDTEGYRAAAARYEKRRAALTNPWTRALATLLTADPQTARQTLREDGQTLSETYQTLTAQTDTPTATQRQLLEEYRYHLSPKGDS
ncbi:MAG: hypothetical protein NC453_14975 [Muribaculum sp.]|nr:hypothetical protein [Muribaculum sp.]